MALQEVGQASFKEPIPVNSRLVIKRVLKLFRKANIAIVLSLMNVSCGFVCNMSAVAVIAFRPAQNHLQPAPSSHRLSKVLTLGVSLEKQGKSY